MFRIGEFSKIAQVSIRMLRHYDEIDLFKPAHIDKFTGYRYYTAEQLPALNRIIALKELGLSLEQVARFMHENPTQDELRGMLMLKKAQTEQAIRDELARLKALEARIEHIEESGNLPDIAFVLKAIPEQHYLSVRKVYGTVEDSMMFMHSVQNALPSRIEKQVGYLMAISHDSFFDTENMDIELGYLVDESFDESISIDGEFQLLVRRLAPVENMVCATYVGSDESAYRTCYQAMGHWLEQHDYHISGAGREVMLQFSSETGEAVTEIQFPVEKLAGQHNLLS